MSRRSPPLQPCLPRPAKEPPAGPGWIHEIKHDGFRILARREAEARAAVHTQRLRFHRAVPEDRRRRSRACRCGHACSTARPSWSTNDGLSVFDLIRYRLRDHDAVLCAFDLIELDGEDLRWRPLEHRKARLADLLRGVRDGIAFNQHFTADGSTVFRHACALGCEAIVSSDSARTIARAASTIGSRSRTRPRRRYDVPDVGKRFETNPTRHRLAI